MNAKLPLEGVRVLDIGNLIAGPVGATILGDFGAEIVKIEQPGIGDALRGTPKDGKANRSGNWLVEGRNKKSVSLNLRKPEGQAILKALVAKSDVLMENFTPGTLERWGLGWEELSAINPRLIMVRVSGYGQTGPYKDRPGFARIAHAFGGLTHLAGMPGGPPVTPGSTSSGSQASTSIWGKVEGRGPAVMSGPLTTREPSSPSSCRVLW